MQWLFSYNSFVCICVDALHPSKQHAAWVEPLLSKGQSVLLKDTTQ